MQRVLFTVEEVLFQQIGPTEFWLPVYMRELYQTCVSELEVAICAGALLSTVTQAHGGLKESFPHFGRLKDIVARHAFTVRPGSSQWLLYTVKS